MPFLVSQAPHDLAMPKELTFWFLRIFETNFFLFGVDNFLLINVCIPLGNWYTHFGSLWYGNISGVTVKLLNGSVYVFVPSINSLLTEIGGFAQGGSVQK